MPSRQKILLIEDNPGDARLIEEFLSESQTSGFQLEWVDHLAEGLERVAQSDVDIILLDLSLPDSKGLDTFTRLYSAAGQIPIIVLSGMDNEELSIKAVKEGAEDYLVKGHVDDHLLGRAIRYAIERKRTRQQLIRYTNELREKNEQMESDLNMAREIQQALLPRHFPTYPANAVPEQSVLQFCHRYQPASTLGGDFFDILPISEHETGVFICDVMGHGVRSALITAVLRGLVEELLPQAADPGKYFTEINSDLVTILRRMDIPMFISAFYLVTDFSRNEIRFANAGHPIPFHMECESGKFETLRLECQKPDIALGLLEDFAYTTCTKQLNAHDLYVLYTDGLYEVENSDSDQFGENRIEDFLKTNYQLPMEQLFDTLLKDIREFSSQVEFADDVCLVGVDVNRTRAAS